MAEENNGIAALARIEAPVAAKDFILPGAPGLTFRSAYPEDFRWFETDEKVDDFDASEMFTSFRKLWVGYEPTTRDQLEIGVYAATIPPERVAVAADYGRLLAGSAWGPDNYGVEASERDFGEVLTGESKTGFDYRTRISVWRRGTDLLILRLQTNDEDAAKAVPIMARFVGSLSFTQPLKDSIAASFVSHDIALPSGGKFSFHLPPHWQPFNSGSESARPIAASIFLDKADPDSNSALGVFAIEVPAGAVAANAPLPDIATSASDLMMENLLPQVTYDRQPIDRQKAAGFDEVTPAHGLFIGKLITHAEPPAEIAATELFAVAPKDVLGIASLGAMPDNQKNMGLMMHLTFAERLVTDDLRAFLAAHPK
ncbi:hypothetical protein [Paracoccus aminophilus]|nr:hypothetical protein [Paracoccus aminophilus]